MSAHVSKRGRVGEGRQRLGAGESVRVPVCAPLDEARLHVPGVSFKIVCTRERIEKAAAK
jgi:hypothetical protein